MGRLCDGCITMTTMRRVAMIILLVTMTMTTTTYDVDNDGSICEHRGADAAGANFD